MAGAGLPRLWGTKPETPLSLGPELDDIVVVPLLNFGNTSVVLRTINALLTTNPPQTAKALLAIRNTARVLPKLVISATPCLMGVIMDALFSSDRMSRGCAAASLCALAATQHGRDFMGIHGPKYGVAAIVKYLQVFLPRGEDGHDLQHACLALANLATEAKCLDQLVRSDVVALMMRVLRGGLAPQLVHVQLQQVVQSVNEMPFAHMPRAVHAAVTLLLNMSCHQSARMQMIQAGLPRLLESVLTLADKRQQAERARVLARFQQHRGAGITGRRSIAASGAAADAATQDHEQDQGHESEHDAQEQQHKEGGGQGEGPVYPPEDVFFTRCKLLAGALGAHHVMANIATMERLAEEAAAVFDPYKTSRRPLLSRSKDFLPPGYLASPMLTKDLERHNISISRPDSPASSATSPSAAEQETPLRRYLSSRSSRSRSPGRQTTFGRARTEQQPEGSPSQPLQQPPASRQAHPHQGGKPMPQHGGQPSHPQGSKPLSAQGSKQIQQHGSKQLHQHASKQLHAHGTGGPAHKQHSPPPLNGAVSMRRPDSAGGRSAVSHKSHKSLKSVKSFKTVKSFRSIKSLRSRSSSPPGGTLEPRLSDIPTRLSASEAAEAIAQLSVSHPDLPRAMIATAVNSPPPKLEKWASMQWMAAATVAGHQISPPQRGRKGMALLQVVDDAMLVSGFARLADGDGSPGIEGAHHHRRHHRRKHHKHRKKHHEGDPSVSDSNPESDQEGGEGGEDPTAAAGGGGDKQHRGPSRDHARRRTKGQQASPAQASPLEEGQEEEEDVVLPVVVKGSLVGTRPPPLFLPSQAPPRVKVSSGVTAGVFRV